MRYFISDRKSVNYALFALVIGILFLIGLYALEFFLKRSTNQEAIFRKIEQTVHKKELKAEGILNKDIYKISIQNQQNENNTSSIFLPEIRKNGFAVQYYLNDSLVYWSDNSISELKISQLASKVSVQKLPNGWYEILTSQKGNETAVCIILLKYEYSFENEYLENEFQEDFCVPWNIGISTSLRGKSITSLSGDPLFSLDFTGYTPAYNEYTWALSLLLLLSFFSLFLALYYGYSAIEWLHNRPCLFVIGFTGCVFLLRILQACLTFPEILYTTSFFSPLYYSSSLLLPSEGDFLINSMFILMIAYVAFKKLFTERVSFSRWSSWRLLSGMLSIAFIISIYVLLCLGLDDIVRNSSFSLDLKDISKIGTLSIIGLLIVYCLSLAFYLFSRTAGIFITSSNKNRKIIFISLSSISVFLVDLFWWDSRIAVILAFLFAVYLSMLLFYFNKKGRNSPLKSIILPMIWISVLVAVVFTNATYLKEREERKLLAIKLATEKNPLTEFLFNKLERKLLNDTVIIEKTKVITAETEDFLIKYIRAEYIKNFWNRFTVQITMCTPGKMLKIQPRGYVFDCEEYFKQVCEKVGEKTTNPNLYYLDYGSGIETYLAVLKPLDSFAKTKSSKVKIYIEFTAKTPAKDLGYPELLIDRRIMNLPDLSNYSYALYQGGSLVYKMGKLSYDLNLNEFLPSSDNALFFSSGGISHYRYNMNKSRVLVVSKKDDSFLGIISPASYLFIAFSFLTLLLNLLFKPTLLNEFSFITLKNRFQIATVGITVVSFLILGGLLLYFLIRLNNLKNMDSFSERTLSVMSEMQDKYGETENLDKPDKSVLEEDLQRLSGMFYTDVNVYSPRGKLILSSRPQIFDEGLISDRMNTIAFMDLKRNKQSAFFQDECIGEYQYTSAYFPLLNDKNEVLAYVNLPFFSRQEDLKKEINDFLVAFMNLYILFILLSVFISLAISRYLSAPLGILVSRMEGFQLGKCNEKISWNHHDEIGRLVDEYNRLIDELAFSADQLAKSERETAWREMARQVAHEIKNPLTPMKLSIQHLQKAWEDQSDDFTLRLKRFTKIMTEQIDSLSAIATEFSDFAKMPLPIAEELDLIEILNSVTSLYSGLENIQIRIETSETAAYLIADKKQLTRVFSNLITNAAQAISNKAEGLIRIVINKQINHYVIDIIDNGDGIPDELTEKIFLPNFTTKSGGAGLGLAIVRGIIRSMDGDVKFASGNEGTTFTVTIPIQYDTFSG